MVWAQKELWVSSVCRCSVKQWNLKKGGSLHGAEIQTWKLGASQKSLVEKLTRNWPRKSLQGRRERTVLEVEIA